MNTFSRALTALLLCVVLFTLTLWRNDAFPDLSGITAFIQDTADTLSRVEQGTGQRPPSDSKASFPLYPLSEELNPELEEAICNAFREHATELDLSAFRLSEETLRAVVTEIRFNHPEFFYVDKEFKYFTSSVGGYVTELKPSYLWDAAQTEVLMVEYRAMIDAIVASIPDGTDFDKLLYLHDYFVQNYCYDSTLTIRDAYTFFKQKTGVCQAYMLALIAVTQEIGIESIPVTSQKMNHAWNLVLLDGEWYHIDITWDDAVSYPSYISYDYFLQSDAGLIGIDADHIDPSMEVPDWHCDWVATKAAVSTKYDTAVWRTANTPMRKAGNAYYCVVSESTPESGKSSVGAVYSGEDPTALSRLFVINGVWRENGGLSYKDCFAGLAVYNGELIYNTGNTLRAYHMTTGANRLLGELPMTGNENIFGICSITDAGMISCVVAPTASGDSYRIVTVQI